MMLSEQQIKCIKAQGLEIIIVEGITMVKDCAESAIERHTEIPIAGNTESHGVYNKLLRRILSHIRFDIPIPDELLAGFARVKFNVVGADGRNQGLELPSAKSHKACAQAKSHKACAQVKPHKACAQPGLTNNVQNKVSTGENDKVARIAAAELSNDSTQGREQPFKDVNVERAKPTKSHQQMIADWQSRQQMTDALSLQLWHESNPPKETIHQCEHRKRSKPEVDLKYKPKCYTKLTSTLKKLPARNSDKSE